MATGCTQAEPPVLSASDMAIVEGYRLGAGDKLRITVYNEPNLTGEYSITPSGTVAFPLIGAIKAGGQTIEQVSQSVTASLAQGYVNNPHVSVEVLNYRPYYILGEVVRPGEFPFVNGMTIEQAVAAAGGFSYRANRNRIYIRRARATEERTVVIREQPIEVQPGDTIRVGERYF
ncbi:polysaccharide biosynthesis/export family protein [Sphingomonas sp. BK481]|uniref:polysaccharide biosynthesis/export family protein n=1 Tax=Sphingomonas sp. BK481 TaxID=2586981 RepID=UPI00288BBF3F|nr:polysaccharide biosynthesis/export family protein [Sphingomonas sp. BK481]